MIKINVVLVRPIYSRNVGSVSRVMANMGANRLILIDPKCEIDLEARQGAAGAQKHLVERTNYKDWAQFLISESEGVMIGFCGRKKSNSDSLPLHDRLKKIHESESDLLKQFYFIFGPEDDGLSLADLEYVHYISKLPTYGHFESLNLSHAVLLALYMAMQSDFKPKKALSTEFIENDMAPLGPEDFSEASTSEQNFFFPKEIVQEWLETIGFQINNRKVDAYQVLKRILLNNLSSQKELRVLEAIIFQTVRKLKNR